MQRRSVGLGVRSTLFTRNHLAFACTAFAISFVGYKCDVVEGQASTTTSQEVCPAVADCMNDAVCSECLSALMSNVAEDEASQNFAVMRTAQENFFISLVGPTCFRNGTVVPFLSAAADEIFNLPCHSMGLNWPRLPVNDLCLSVEFNCALNPDCRQCLHGIYTSANKSGELRELSSPSCGAVGANGLFDLSVCNALQRCTFAKQQCADDATLNCPICLDLMRNGDVAGALERCSSSLADNSAVLLGNVAYFCMGNTDLTCNYFISQCGQDAACGNCLADIGGAQTSRDMAEGFLNSSSCMSTFTSNNPSSTQAHLLLYRVFLGCPLTVFTRCQEFTAMCLIRGGEACANCIAGSTSQQNDPSCEPLLNAYNVLDACLPCSTSVYESNRIVLATSIVGGVSILPCIVVILGIIAYGKDLMYIRSRIIMGLMISNIVYSIGNAIPVGMLDQTNIATCGQTSLSFNTIRFGRAWWFAGKYALVFFELFVLAVTTWALKCGLRKLGVFREAVLHATCTLAGVAAFLGFFVKSDQIESDGYNAATQAELLSGAFSHLGANDEVDDDYLPAVNAAQRFSTARNEYDTLVQQMLQVWIAFLGMSILLWFYLRWTFARLTKSWLLTLSEAEDQWNRDLWAPDQQGERQTKRRFLELTKESYEELFRPLEPFVAVFIVFGIPACFMATDYCQERSHGSAAGNSYSSVVAITVGKCDVVCELILSFRSIATVAVFFYSREHRNEIYHFRTMFRRLRARVKGWFQSSDSRHSSGVRFRDLLLEEVQMIPRLDDGDYTTCATVPYKLMDDEDAEGTGLTVAVTPRDKVVGPDDSTLNAY
jgi:hypothetical protein